jgi:S-formylglutathione hydrolase FrmB
VKKNYAKLALLVALVPIWNTVVAAQSGRLEDVRVHAVSLERNLLGDSADKRVLVYLPPSYDASARHYPTVYILHGFSLGPSLLDDWGSVTKDWMDKLIAAGQVQEMIAVTPNGQDAYRGSFYTNSEVAGNYEDYISKDLVGYVDSHYRTIPKAESRGLGGHSMGGYGAFMLGMKHPDVFAATYSLSACCFAFAGDLTSSNPAWHETIALKTRGDVENAVKAEKFYVVALLAMSAAFSPDEKAGPLFADEPYRESGGKLIASESTVARWESHLPVNLVERYRENLLKLRGIWLDYGTKDEFSHIPIGTAELSQKLAKAGIPHVFEVFDGTHDNKAPERVGTKMLPYFSGLLVGEGGSGNSKPTK